LSRSWLGVESVLELQWSLRGWCDGLFNPLRIRCGDSSGCCTSWSSTCFRWRTTISLALLRAGAALHSRSVDSTSVLVIPIKLHEQHACEQGRLLAAHGRPSSVCPPGLHQQAGGSGGHNGNGSEGNPEETEPMPSMEQLLLGRIKRMETEVVAGRRKLQEATAEITRAQGARRSLTSPPGDQAQGGLNRHACVAIHPRGAEAVRGGGVPAAVAGAAAGGRRDPPGEEPEGPTPPEPGQQCLVVGRRPHALPHQRLRGGPPGEGRWTRAPLSWTDGDASDVLAIACLSQELISSGAGAPSPSRAGPASTALDLAAPALTPTTPLGEHLRQGR
jgi:hypothetical protein